MALLLLSNRSISRAGVRAVSMRDVVSISVIACTVVSGLAFAAGLTIGKWSGADEQARLASPVQSNDPLRDGFAMQRLGEISARMMALEGNATNLLKRLSGIEQIQGSLNKLDKAGIAPRMDALPVAPKVNAAPRGAAGGPELAPVCDVRAAYRASPGPTLENVRQAEGALSCLQSLIDHIEQSAASRSVALMALPNRQPMLSVELGSPFGNRVDPITGHIAFHPGLDFAAPMGSDILAAGGGKVRFSGFQNELGYLVEIDHGNGLISRYAHASKLYVKEGEIVAPGQKISAVGSTGRSTGPHLHFEILHEGRYVDPMQYLNGLSRDGNVSPQS